MTTKPEPYPTPEQVLFGFLLKHSVLRKHVGRQSLEIMGVDMVVQLKKYGYSIVLRDFDQPLEVGDAPEPVHTDSLRYVGHRQRSNPDMFWVVDCPFVVGKRNGISFNYYATVEEALEKRPHLKSFLPGIIAAHPEARALVPEHLL